MTHFRPATAAEVLALVLCPAAAFARAGDLAPTVRALAPVKREIVRRFWAARQRT